MSLPRDERSTVSDNDRPIAAQVSVDDREELATRSLLGLAAATVIIQTERQQKLGAAAEVPSANVGLGLQYPAPEEAEDAVHLNGNDSDSNGSPFSGALPTNFTEIMSARARTPNPNDLRWMGVAMEWATGKALRSEVLEPVASQFSGLSQSLFPEAVRFLGIYSRGELVLRGCADGSVDQCSIDRVQNRDAPVIAKWWEGDKFLSHTDQAWSDWWIHRCHIFDPGCEMVKLIDGRGETLGVAYYERNIVDRNSFGKDGLGRIALIRGIRVAPSLNPEVLHRRGDVPLEHVDAVGIHQTVASLLFYHVLFMSVRYGCNAVAVNCPKDERSERFYEAFMGLPVAFDGRTGRRFHRIGNQDRWRLLRKAFYGQVELWLQQIEVAIEDNVHSS